MNNKNILPPQKARSLLEAPVFPSRKTKRSLGIPILILLLLVAAAAAAFLFLREPAIEAMAPSVSPSATVYVSVYQETQSPSPSAGVSFEVIKTPKKQSKYIFLMIGDGMGEAQRNLAESFADLNGEKTSLIINSLPVSGKVTTASANASVTDSAASATALSTGHKTNNGMIAVAPDGEELKTIIEQAEDNGLSTGLVTTTSITNATPAAFAAHQKSRGSEADIALDYLDSGVDFFAGGGASFFLPASYSGGGLDAAGRKLASSRKDDTNLVSDFEQAGYVTFIGAQGAAEFSHYIPSAGDKVFASFTNSHMPYAIDAATQRFAAPSLAGMTRTAIQTLQTDDDGFVLMVEGGRIDHACHINDAAGAVFETLSFNDAVEEAYAFYSAHPEETLIIVVADHETGGLKINNDKLDLSHINDIRLSLQDSLQSVYNGDRDAFSDYLADNFGLNSLNPSETSRIKKALNTADKAKPDKGYGSVVARAVADILSDRIGVSWKGTGHTGVPVPLYAVGMRAQDFSGNIDNTDIGRLIFDILSDKTLTDKT